jgi:hypothetical protein
MNRGAENCAKIEPRGLRIAAIAEYTGFSPFYVEELIRSGMLPSIGGPGSGVCRAHIVLREHLDQFLDRLAKKAKERTKCRQKERREGPLKRGLDRRGKQHGPE